MINKLKGHLFTESVTCFIQSLPPLVKRCGLLFDDGIRVIQIHDFIYLTSVRSDFVILMFLRQTERQTLIDNLNSLQCAHSDVELKCRFKIKTNLIR